MKTPETGSHLGKRVRDKITGFEGIAVAFTTYLFGCATYGISPKVDDNGAIQDTVYFDWMRLEIVDNGPFAHEAPDLNTGFVIPGGTPGGPNRDAPGRSF